MEGNAMKSLFQDEYITEELLLDEKLNEIISENEIGKKSVEELTKHEETLTTYLTNLKKENFILETTVKAWKTTLKDKLEEFKETQLKLDEIHNEIQSERDNFCSELDNFNDNYGVLSNWWEKQMNEIENLGEKYFEEEKCKKEIQKLEQEIEDLKKQRNEQGGYEVFESPERSEISEDEIVCEGKGCDIVEKMFSLVDIEKVRMANRRNRRKAVFDKNQIP